MDAVKLSHYIVSKYENVSAMKLQKLLYYVKVWGVVSGEDLLDASFQKWNYGPVNYEVYQLFKKYANSYIPKQVAKKVTLPKEQKKTIKFVLDCYSPYDAVTLSAMTHADDPWKQAAINQAISNGAIQHYYSKLPFAKNFPFDPEKPFYPVQTDLHYAYIFDMSEKDAKSLSSYPSFKTYKKQLQKAKKDFKHWLKHLG
ncbi:MAG TPA: type II toxin-antitoxin system antitoxin SocA domain-containing protein [Bacteroidota bacterium]|nr:type II toxin-antitoxin system antitoxin SocA domain-containing protein [Bacteroidota bacterium]HLE32176.1 type II toxin-antitoxin system antitoxin SocA domain-containing protein [Bacteroidota bacterium]